MEEKSLNILEFNKILELIAQKAVTDKAKENIRAMRPLMYEDMIERAMDTTSQAAQLIRQAGTLPLYGYLEASEFVVHAQKGGTLRQGGLLRIAACLNTAKQIKRYIEDAQDSPELFPILNEYSYELNGLTPLAKQLSEAIISETELADTASPLLYDIRRKIRTANAKIKDKLNSIITSAETRKYLQENLVTMRNNRYVVPVKSENKGNIPGIVHEASQSGLTLFIEPAAVVALNNTLKELEIEEEREIDAILKAFSGKVSQNAEIILNDEKVIILLDEYFARAAYAYENDLIRPEITQKRKITLYKARHPLLDAKQAVASDIILGETYIQMIITGPNTGGKTVCLKTLGLCVAMAQSGLFIPANEGSCVCIMDNIFADIGDEQSIAQSLSTFSAHMTNIVGILEKTNERTLVLLDELGAGTDPAEGAALAWAILNELRLTKALCAATTHYNEIKQYALSTPLAVNASVEFDVKNLKPTYVLSIGLPGKSNAFEISARLGLNRRIIESARETMSGAAASFEDILKNLNEKLFEANAASHAAKQELAEAKLMREEAQRLKDTAEEDSRKLLSDAAVSGKKIVAEAREAAKTMLSAADRYAQNKGSRPASDEIDSISSDINSKLNAAIPLHAIRKADSNIKQEHEFKNDEEVYIKSLDADAVILYIEKNYAMIQAGIIKTKVPLSELSVKRTKKEKKFAYTGMKARDISSRLDIRGITAGEVELEVEKYLDDAVLAGLKTVTVVHGKGEGILKKAVEDVLRHHPSVVKFRSGGLNEGGTGATIVDIE